MLKCWLGSKFLAAGWQPTMRAKLKIKMDAIFIYSNLFLNLQMYASYFLRFTAVCLNLYAEIKRDLQYVLQVSLDNLSF